LYILTRKGASLYAATERAQRAWAASLIDSMPTSDLHVAKRLLETMSEQLTGGEAQRSAKSAKPSRRVR